MKTFINLYKTIYLFVFMLAGFWSYAQSDWPVMLISGDVTIHVYKPETESFNVNKLSFRSAVSITEGNEAPVFGLMWGDANIQTNKTDRSVVFKSLSISEIRFPDGMEAMSNSDVGQKITRGIADKKPKLMMDDILSDLDNAHKEASMAGKMNNKAPKIIYTQNPSVLVSIDGNPILQATDVKGVEMVVNTPFLILKSKNAYYLGNGAIWYKSATVLSGWSSVKSVPSEIKKAAESLADKENQTFAEESANPQLIVTTEPAELIQTDGMPDMSPLKGTNLLYVNNTDNDLFMNIADGKYYVLLSGRWYSSKKMDGEWEYVESENLPSEFRNITEGSDKDAVLASISGTKAANDAVRDAQIPQAAVVDRRTAKTEVVYDGNPQFEEIEGTNMRYAANSSNTVIVERNRYYVVDNGVWFAGDSPNGPWIVSDQRPVQINVIPPSCPAYNVRYVNIYHSTPTVVYVGYTRGYLSGYVCGGTVVYGTGYRYRPWHGNYYYPRPCTWGFGMSYNPWSGWNVSVGYASGWFDYDYYHHHRPHYYHGYRRGWWGPPVYRPPYCVPYTHHYGSRPAVMRSYGYPRNMRVYPDRAYASRPSNVYRPGDRGVTAARPSSGRSRDNYITSYSRQAQPQVSRESSAVRPSRPSSGSRDREQSVNVSSRPSRDNQNIPPRGQGSSSRPQTDGQSGTRPNTDGSSRPSRPSTGSSRPNTGGNSGTQVRPGTGSSARPDNNNQTTPPTTRPSGGSSTRPGTSGGTGSQTRPSTRPDNNNQTTPPVTTRPSGGGSRPSTGSGNSRPAQTAPPTQSRPSQSSGSGSSSRQQVQPRQSSGSSSSSGRTSGRSSESSNSSRGSERSGSRR